MIQIDELDIQLYGAGLSRIYGPYVYKGRRHIALGYGGSKVGKTYAAYLMERHLKERIEDDVHHKNEDKLDDRIDNYEIKTRSQHTKDHMSRGNILELTCHCGKVFKRLEWEVKASIRKGNKRTCCSSRCGRIKSK